MSTKAVYMILENNRVHEMPALIGSGRGNVKVRYRKTKRVKEKNEETIVVERRSNNGCLTCRDRHKKCNEQRPICSGCRENFLNCVWRDHEEHQEASHMFLNFRIDEWKVRKKHKKRTSYYFAASPKLSFYNLTTSEDAVAIVDEENGSLEKLERFPTVRQLGLYDDDEEELNLVDGNGDFTTEVPTTDVPFFDASNIWLSRQGTPHLTDSLQMLNSSIEKAIEEYTPNNVNRKVRQENTFYNYLFDDTHPLAQKFDSVMKSLNRGEFDVIPKYCTDELFLLYIAVKYWLVNTGPQETHPLLTTLSTFTRNFQDNPVLKEVFLCCGATFMEYYESEIFSKLSTELYQSTLMLIKKYLEDNPEEDNKPWLLASYQLLCVRNKTAINSTVNDCVQCLSNAYRVIKSPYYLAKIKSIATTEEKYVEELVLEIEHDTSLKKPELEPHDRMYLESFIYNYSVALLWAVDISKLPNPYSVYGVLGKYLRCFIYQCDFRWMNNPIVGASFEAFEILAKVSYIARLPLPLDKNGIWYKRALQLQKQAYYHTPSILPNLDQAKIGEKMYNRCKVNLLVGEIVAKTSFLLISKVIEYKKFDILSCQKLVSEIVKNIEKIPKGDLIWAIVTWSVIVCGVFTTDSENQKKILSFLDYIRDKFHLLPLFNSKIFLFETWKLPINERLDILFDRDNLARVNA